MRTNRKRRHGADRIHRMMMMMAAIFTAPCHTDDVTTWVAMLVAWVAMRSQEVMQGAANIWPQVHLAASLGPSKWTRPVARCCMIQQRLFTLNDELSLTICDNKPFTIGLEHKNMMDESPWWELHYNGVHAGKLHYIFIDPVKQCLLFNLVAYYQYDMCIKTMVLFTFRRWLAYNMLWMWSYFWIKDHGCQICDVCSWGLHPLPTHQSILFVPAHTNGTLTNIHQFKSLYIRFTPR
jgi:hypothetical protein